jgi:hypothetical protein
MYYEYKEISFNTSKSKTAAPTFCQHIIAGEMSPFHGNINIE